MILVCQLQSWLGEKECIKAEERVSRFNGKMLSQHFHLLIPLHNRNSVTIIESDIYFSLDNFFQKLKYRNERMLISS